MSELRTPRHEGDCSSHLGGGCDCRVRETVFDPPRPEVWNPQWDVFRDDDGNPVTITLAQVRAIWHAMGVWRDVYRTEKGKEPDLQNTANMSKSCLLGRMLIEGRRPLAIAPPVMMAAPQYHLLDPDLCSECAAPLPDHYPRCPIGAML